MISNIASTGDRAPTLQNDPMGIRRFPDWLSKYELAELDQISAALKISSVGRRVLDDTLRPLLISNGSLMKLTRSLLGTGAKAVRAVFFNKTNSNNWSTPWHQDRTIPVRSKHVLNGYDTWSIKDGVHHVEPPISLLENMVTLKVHIDPCPLDAGPIRIAEGRTELAGCSRLTQLRLHKIYASIFAPPMLVIFGPCRALFCTPQTGQP